MLKLKEMAKKQKGNLILLGVYAFFSGASILGQAYLFATIIDGVFLKGVPFSDITTLLAGLLFVLFARTLFNYLIGKTGIKMASRVKRGLRQFLLRTYSNTTLQSSIHGQSGQKVSVLLDAVDKVDSYFSKYIPKIFQATIIPVLIFIVIFFEHVPTGVIILITAPFIPIYMVVIGFKTKDKSEEQLHKMAAFSGKFLDTLQGLTTLKLFGHSQKQKEEIRKSSLEFRDATMDVLKIAFQNSLILEFVSMLSIGLIALEVAIRMIIFQDLSFYTGFLMLILAPEFYNKLKELGSAFHTGKGSIGAANVIEEELENTFAPVTWGEEHLDEKTPPTIVLSKAGFRYGDAGFSLTNINLVIHPYENVAIVGKTGSGKTTLLHVLAGLFPLTAGKILINGNPRDMYKEEEWFGGVSYISQSPYLFSGTIAENIAVGSRHSTTMEEIEHAGEKAGIAEVVRSLADGYDTKIGEVGRGLSGGEKQRIAIARAFLKRPSVILFDEPTTGLDLYTERILQESLDELSRNATVITVAHRLHTIQRADKIMVMEDGKIITAGTHQELLNHALYKRMVSVQQGGA
ncbi:thiol reductant ABC exporter subunit CydD [Oceanobacillus salinisoli]|uniref:thiol reductant ABC exporter subunit CydD n=1 Tax=Oceanobacillus salinisoli TaxID=2678611 RepID=UPI0012E143EF|nr:thiol reductant ABC exporter subunit CydD [Oceanobacillus salinisoli]